MAWYLLGRGRHGTVWHGTAWYGSMAWYSHKHNGVNHFFRAMNQSTCSLTSMHLPPFQIHKTVVQGFTPRTRVLRTQLELLLAPLSRENRTDLSKNDVVA